MIGYETFEPGNFVPQDGVTLRGAAAAPRAGYRVTRCLTAEGPAVVPAAKPCLGTPGD